MLIYPVRVDIKGNRTVGTDSIFTSGDVQAYRLQFVFYDGETYSVTGCSLMVKGKRNDGVVVADKGVIDAEGNAFYDVKSSMYQVPGQLSLEVALVTADGGYITVKEVLISVREGYGEGEIAENAMPLLAELETKVRETNRVLERAERATEAAEQAAVEENIRIISERERVEAEGERRQKEAEREQLKVATEAVMRDAQAAADKANAAAEAVELNGIKGSAYGTAVFMDDVSPVTHTPTVKVSGVEDLSIVTLVQSGKNLNRPFEYSSSVNNGNLSLIFSNNLLTLNGSSTNNVSVNNKGSGCILPPGTYTFSNQYVSGECINTVSSSDKAFYFNIRKKSGSTLATFSCYGKASMESTRSATFTLTETTEIIFYFVGGGEYENYQSRIMINVGELPEPYEDYKEIRYGVNADGTVEKVALYHPYTSLLPDASGAVVSCEYNKDTNKVIEKLTNAIISLGGNV